MDNFLSSLGLAMKAGKVVYGADPVMINSGRIHLLLLASDSGSSTRRNARHLAGKHNFTCVEVAYGKAELGFSIGKKPCALVAVTDRGFAQSLLKKLDTTRNNPTEGGLHFD